MLKLLTRGAYAAPPQELNTAEGALLALTAYFDARAKGREVRARTVACCLLA